MDGNGHGVEEPRSSRLRTRRASSGRLSSSADRRSPAAPVTGSPPGFAGGDASWVPVPGTPRPTRLDRPVTALDGVGPALAKKLAGLGLRSIRDLVEYRPRRYEAAAPERRIADLFGEDEVVIAGEVRGRGAPPAAAALDRRAGSPTGAARSTRSGSTRSGSPSG